MREIKFRAWDKDFLKMHWFLEKSHNLPTPQPLHWYLENKDRFDIMQFTGLNDKNGNPIYEGDIVIWNAYQQYEKMIVYFRNGAFHFKRLEIENQLDWQNVDTDDIEIIGNIHEHQNLLK